MVRKYAITEDEFLGMHIDPADGHLKTVRDNGDPVDFGTAMGPSVTDSGVAEFIADPGSLTATQLSATMADEAADTGSALAAQIGLNIERATQTIDARRFGVAAGTTADNTVALQAALDAAADSRLALSLPPGKIKVQSQVRWKHRLHSIIGTQSTSLDFTGATSGPAILMDPTGADATLPRTFMADLSISGPTGIGTTVDGISHLTDFDTKWAEFRRVRISGFRDQVSLKTNSYLWSFEGVTFDTAVRNSVRLAGTNMGENFNFLNCTFQNNTNAPFIFLEPENGSSMFLRGCSLDFGAQIAEIQGGSIEVASCHMEGRYSGAWFTIKAGGSRPSALLIRGGAVIVQPKVVNTGVCHLLVRIDPTTVKPDESVVVSVDGTSVVDRSSLGMRMLRDTSTQPDRNMITMRPVIGMVENGMRISMGVESSLVRNSSLSTALTLTTGAPTISDDSFVSGMSSAYTFDAAKVGRDGTVGAAKFDLAATGRTTILSKRFRVPDDRRPVLFSLATACEHLTTTGSALEYLVEWYSAANIATSLGGERGYPEALRFSYNNLTDVTRDWLTGDLLVMPPRGAGFCQIRFCATNSTGTLWVRDMEATQL
ncbi:MAG TPA: hypothetical protein VN041_13985 [Microbacterium sp.]|nr:hypothetical protein [Microbacterium sp.]